MSDTQGLGKRGEELAAAYLKQKGYTILAANYHSRFGEIDLIARRGPVVAFVEVKLRKNANFAAAYEAVTYGKQQKIKKTAARWILNHPDDVQYRFDIVEVYTDSKQINHYENAFE